jgi:16S rRNA (uracil1498-N3)-methyltransferase
VSAPLFFVEAIRPGEPVRLSAEDSRHAVRSLRLRPGDDLSVADGRGALAMGRLAVDDRGQASVEVRDVRRVTRPAPTVTVAMAPPKGDRLAWAVQKLAEVGTDDVILVRTERAVRRWEGERIDRALARVRTVAREAAMQSRRPFVMPVTSAVELADVLAPGPGRVVMLWEGATEPLHAVLPPDRDVTLLVGPEGGFTEAEVHAARQAGAAVASLGPATLRTETAAVVAATLALASFGRLG